jgi:hypothetical protein
LFQNSQIPKTVVDFGIAGAGIDEGTRKVCEDERLISGASVKPSLRKGESCDQRRTSRWQPLLASWLQPQKASLSTCSKYWINS